MNQGMLIGEVTAQSGLSRKALRLYEARGILYRRRVVSHQAIGAIQPMC